MSQISEISLKPSFSAEHTRQLAELSTEIYRETGALGQMVPAERTRREIARLLSGMNSYYSNLIEGVKTLPFDVEASLAEDFSERPDDGERRSLAIAHIETESSMRQHMEEENESFSVHSASFIQWLHTEFYGHLPNSLRKTLTKSGRELIVEPGAFRDRGVSVGRHRPPLPGEIGPILAEFDRYFSDGDWLATDQLAIVAAAHHRLAWVHPFLDGNGRIARLYSHACLIQAQVDGGGLWSLSRGLARHRQRYYDALESADATDPFEERRRLSETGLGEFSIFFLETLLDQVKFMKDLLELHSVTSRMEKYIRYELDPKKHGEALARLLKAIFVDGEVARGEVKTITGLKDTAAREVINLAFKHRLIQSPTPKGRLALNFPASTLNAFFPRLYLDLPE